MRELCLALSAHILVLGNKGGMDECRALAEEALASGRALDVFMNMVTAQGGDVSVIKDTGLLPSAAVVREALACEDGYIARMDAEKCGIAAGMLGAGRAIKDDVIDPGAGIVLIKKPGDAVKNGEAIARLHTSDEKKIADAEAIFLSGVAYSKERIKTAPLILGKAGME